MIVLEKNHSHFYHCDSILVQSGGGSIKKSEEFRNWYFAEQAYNPLL